MYFQKSQLTLLKIYCSGCCSIPLLAYFIKNFSSCEHRHAGQNTAADEEQSDPRHRIAVITGLRCSDVTRSGRRGSRRNLNGCLFLSTDRTFLML